MIGSLSGPYRDSNEFEIQILERIGLMIFWRPVRICKIRKICKIMHNDNLKRDLKAHILYTCKEQSENN